MAIEAVDHGAEALAEVLSQYDDSPKFRALVEGLAARYQAIEDDVIALRDEALLSTSAGALLDRLGELLEVPRGSRDDEDYRRVIQTRIASRRAGGTPESILTVLSVLGGDVLVKYYQIGVASYQVEFQTGSGSELTTQQIADITAELPVLSPAGVGFTVTEANSSKKLRFDSGPGFDLGVFGRSITRS